ncbi:hypothetical protein F0919_08630 [Taibaiella lutea]|uniref:Uncharacterized protein n=1 Tax=Taibaiella lutea TaxID=2608001 RepID=A0A5M6CJQ6_9BACT|nr:hypothetical protein [Taibaiella lutea]KAA5534670.1 hypothetical protein F0919_08630 [Taibaiella lutea]
MKDLIRTQLEPELREQIDQKIGELENLLNGNLVALTEEQRQAVGMINEQNKLFVNKVHDYNRNKPGLSADDVDWREFESDFESREYLETRKTRLASLVYQMESTKMMHDNDNYSDALADYAYAQYKKGRGLPGFAEKVADLKQFFPRSSRKKSEEPTEDNA